jgi:hypothetical protein
MFTASRIVLHSAVFILLLLFTSGSSLAPEGQAEQRAGRVLQARTAPPPARRSEGVVKAAAAAPSKKTGAPFKKVKIQSVSKQVSKPVLRARSPPQSPPSPPPPPPIPEISPRFEINDLDKRPQSDHYRVWWLYIRLVFVVRQACSALTRACPVILSPELCVCTQVLLILAWKRLYELPLYELDSYFQLAGIHGAPYVAYNNTLGAQQNTGCG